MTVPIWMLLGFAIWTLLLLFASVGVYRWSRILTRRAQIKEFHSDHVEGEDWYRRAMRAHTNCIENLPVFGVIVFALYVSKLEGNMINCLAITILIARIVQSTIHVAFAQTNTVTLFRFIFYLIQVICFLWLTVILVIPTGISG